MTEVRVEHVDAVWARVRCEDSVAMELSDRFSFEAPGHKYHPAFRAGHWDGRTRLFNVRSRTIYRGLESAIAEYCREQGYEFGGDDGSAHPSPDRTAVDEFVAGLDLPADRQLRDYQLDALRTATTRRRVLFHSPVNSGKSLIMYLIYRWHNVKTLLVVPRSDLVEQMYGDFKSYGCDMSEVHKIKKGVRDTERQLTITTWQAIKDMPLDWFAQFECVLGDEVHLFTAKSLAGENVGRSRYHGVMERLTEAELRYGFTGTLQEAKTHRLTLVGLFGEVHETITNAEMQERGFSSPLEIQVIVLEHPEWVRKLTAKEVKKRPGLLYEYADEVDFTVGLRARNEFLCGLCLSQERNTVLITRFVEKHGAVLDEMLRSMSDQKVLYTHGGVSGDARNEMRLEIEESEKVNVVASFGVFSTGNNVRNLHNMIFGTGYKSAVTNMQSIGRILRLFGQDKRATLFDVADDMSLRGRGRVKLNHSMRHLQERIKLYNAEGFEHRIHRFRLNYQPGDVFNEP